MEQFIVSARKYRPSSFGTLLGQENIARTLKNSIERGQLAHAYLFCGPRGVGKTSAARIFAKIINCSNPGPDLEPCGECESCRSFAENRSYCIHELDAASNNSVDDIRALTEQVRIPPQVGRYSVYIIDEVHMLTQSAFNAFLKTLEEPPAHAIFILATTEKHKIIPTVLSRCQTFDFNRIRIEDMVRNLKFICSQEGVNMDEDAMHIIAQKADGAMRDALTLFDQTVAFCGRDVTYEQVIRNLNVLDYDYYFSLTDDFFAGDYPHALMTFDEILSKGFNALGFIGGLCSHFRDLMVCKNEASQTLVELAPSVAEKYRQYAQKCPVGFLFDALTLATTCEAGFKQSGNPRLSIEFTLMKICNLITKFAAPSAEPLQVPATPAAQPRQTASAPQPAPAPKPAPQPAAQPEPQPARKSSGLSIKAMMQEFSTKPAAGSAAETTASKTETKPAVSLEEAWKALAESESRMPRLSSAISGAKPSRDDMGNIHFEVGNAAQKEWIDRNCRTRLESFLRDCLGEAAMKLIVDVKAVEKLERGPYMPSEKAKFLQESSPEFKALSNDFELETN